MTFDEVYKEYLEYASKRHKKQGFDTITKNFKLHILPYFKGKIINKLTKFDIISWQNIIYDKNFSNNFNRNLYYEFSAFMNYCVLYEYIKDNIVLQVDNFKKKFEVKKRKTYNLLQYFRFDFFMNDFVIKQYFHFMYFYGTRPSEAMALRFLDLDNFTLHIVHSIHRKGKRELDTPKNQSSVRDIKITIFMLFRIWLLKRYYKKIFGHCCNDYFIFGGKKPLSPTTIDRRKKEACDKAKLFCITQHEFRHSYATHKIRIGKPINEVSKSMGHSTVSMTVDVYLH